MIVRQLVTTVTQ